MPNSNSAIEASDLIYSFPRGEKDEIQMAITKYKGRQYIDLRIWFQEPEKGTLIPSKKGISFSVDKLTDLKEGIKRIEAACLKQSAPAPENRPAASAQYPKRQSSAWAGQKNS